MSVSAIETRSLSATRWLHGLWEYYREYTHTAVHAASAAALTAFGLLIFVNRLFVVLAIAAYICPPVILYSIDSDAGRPSDSSTAPPLQADSGASPGFGSDSDPDGNDGDSDSDSDDGDSDSDSDDGDSDSDSDDGDSDSDGDDGDSDSDSDDGDTDTDGSDADADGADADADG